MSKFEKIFGNNLESASDKKIPQENRLPLRVRDSQLLSAAGKESEVHQVVVTDHASVERLIALKEMRSVVLANDEEMVKLKAQYESMKNDPAFGKFVIDTYFIKAQRDETKPARAYLIQKRIPSKRIDEMSNQEIYGDSSLVAELLEFAKAATAMLQKTKSTPEHTPDFYADRENFLGNLLHNPRYSGNILIAPKEANLPHRVYFVDTGTLMGPGHGKDTLKKLRRQLDNRLQLAQFRRWVRKLEQTLESPNH